jgi:hypothetical protein
MHTARINKQARIYVYAADPYHASLSKLCATKFCADYNSRKVLQSFTTVQHLTTFKVIKRSRPQKEFGASLASLVTVSQYDSGQVLRTLRTTLLSTGLLSHV